MIPRNGVSIGPIETCLRAHLDLFPRIATRKMMRAPTSSHEDKVIGVLRRLSSLRPVAELDERRDCRNPGLALFELLVEPLKPLIVGLAAARLPHFGQVALQLSPGQDDDAAEEVLDEPDVHV